MEMSINGKLVCTSVASYAEGKSGVRIYLADEIPWKCANIVCSPLME